MKSLWNDKEAAKFGRTLLGLRVYSSRLLGKNPDLILPGGGNTSVKIKKKDFFGSPTDILYVKGSGLDLQSINREGFSPCFLEILQKMATMDQLSDSDMVAQGRAAMLDAESPTPSIEAIVHAVIPHRYVDHTHADAVLALTNSPGALRRIRDLYGDRVIVIPYVMPGFLLAKEIQRKLKGAASDKVEGLILMNHGIFTFHNNAKDSYELMIKLVSLAEKHIKNNLRKSKPARSTSTCPSLEELADIRKLVSEWRGQPVHARLDSSDLACGFSKLSNVKTLACKGPLTPDHVIRAKRIPVLIGNNIQQSIDDFARKYSEYFNKYSEKGMTMLDPSPRWAVWPARGIISFGSTLKETKAISDIAQHTVKIIQQSEVALGGWKPLPASEIFKIEYWELEQAKLHDQNAPKALYQGKVALVTGSAGGIGLACAEALANDGATVIGLDLNAEVLNQMERIGGFGKVVNLTNENKVEAAIKEIVKDFGGLDFLVSNAGIFTAGAYLEDLDQANWNKSIAVNLTSHQVLLKKAIPFLKKGIQGSIVIIGSRNVIAPGAGAASYSCAKAGLTQLCRVASLELAPYGVRCNIIHPDAVFDTKLWTPEALNRSAERYGITVEEYKTRNLMKAEIRSADVGLMASTMCGPTFSKTTGAQVPVDGGNDRVI